ncbi:MAG: M48 family metallopeptidase [Agathobaculum sp.]|uniref:M48 family metallopeptidase n=1 Tax=Agathobaculum sp. TaxID=2048138 RepID=UPI003D92C5F4
MADYEVRRSRRRTLSLEVTREGCVVVRAPLRVSQAEIERFVAKHAAWLTRAQDRQRAWREAHPEPDAERQAVLKQAAQRVLPERTAYFAQLMCLRPAGVRITSARTRFGSCSTTNRLCFSWRLMDYPAEAVDYVVVHELAHIVHKNHGPEFWALVAQYLPDYRARRAMLR